MRLQNSPSMQLGGVESPLNTLVLVLLLSLRLNLNVVVTARTAGSGMRGSSCSAISLFPLLNARTQSSSSSSCRRSAAIALSTDTPT